MVFALLIIAISLSILALFALPRFSPIPYFPSNRKDLPLIIKALSLVNDQIIYDLGAGDGTVIFEAARNAYQKKMNTRFVAVEINPALIVLLYIRRLLHPYKKSIKIIWGNMFTMQYNGLTRQSVSSLTFYLYISPWFIERVAEKIKKTYPNARIVSYMYPIPKLKAVKTFDGTKRIFIYN